MIDIIHQASFSYTYSVVDCSAICKQLAGVSEILSMSRSRSELNVFCDLLYHVQVTLGGVVASWLVCLILD